VSSAIRELTSVQLEEDLVKVQQAAYSVVGVDEEVSAVRSSLQRLDHVSYARLRPPQSLRAKTRNAERKRTMPHSTTNHLGVSRISVLEGRGTPTPRHQNANRRTRQSTSLAFQKTLNLMKSSRDSVNVALSRKTTMEAQR
jgi:hypothetical protein